MEDRQELMRVRVPLPVDAGTHLALVLHHYEPLLFRHVAVGLLRLQHCLPCLHLQLHKHLLLL